MIKKNRKQLILTSIVILLPIIVGLLLWKTLPDRVPSHWNAAGEVDRWSSKGFTVFGLPLIMLGVQWLCVLCTALDPKKHQHTSKILHLVFWIIPILSIVLHIIIYATALGKNVPVEMVLPVFMGLLFVIIGNYLPKCKQNHTIGIRIPWTLNSEENWNKTHRFAGRLWVICGLIILLTGFFGGFVIFFVVLILMVIIPFIYSYRIYKKSKLN